MGKITFSLFNGLAPTYPIFSSYFHISQIQFYVRQGPVFPNSTNIIFLYFVWLSRNNNYNFQRMDFDTFTNNYRGSYGAELQATNIGNLIYDYKSV